HSSISRTVKLFRSLLDNNIQKVLGINLSSFDWVIEVSEPAHPDVAYTKTFDFHLDLIWFFFPMFIFRRVFERHFIKQIPRSVDIHLSRLAYQWEIRINKTIDEIGEQALRYIKDELSTIEAMISKSSGDKEEIRRKMDELYEGMEKIAL
ncbi:MAG: hypothetical protein N2745_09450, partial [Syntrophorhabdaceae bacterium]|nr:hypothetical protein [Syntrophorhabdaceae bacterium]